jgi:hypothetical protein
MKRDRDYQVSRTERRIRKFKCKKASQFFTYFLHSFIFQAVDQFLIAASFPEKELGCGMFHLHSAPEKPGYFVFRV